VSRQRRSSRQVRCCPHGLINLRRLACTEATTGTSDVVVTDVTRPSAGCGHQGQRRNEDFEWALPAAFRQSARGRNKPRLFCTPPGQISANEYDCSIRSTPKQLILQGDMQLAFKRRPCAHAVICKPQVWKIRAAAACSSRGRQQINCFLVAPNTGQILQIR
jgi:hypothetical protein